MTKAFVRKTTTTFVPLSHLPSRNLGFSLIELMIAMVLGITVIGGAIAAFSSASRSGELSQAISQLQANARFALDAVSTDIRMAGHLGCASSERARLNISTSKSPTSNFSTTSIAAAIVGESNWQSSLPTGYTPPTGAGEPVPGTHLIHLQYAASPGYELASDMTGRSTGIVVNGDASELRVGGLAVISNCDTGDLFEVSSIGGAGDQRIVSPVETLTQPYLSNQTTINTTRVMPFVSSIYYIGDTTRVNEHNDVIRSLYLQTFPYNSASNPPLELIEGVDHMLFDLGLWQPDNTVNYKLPGAPDITAQTISAVRVGLLMASTARQSGSTANKTHVVAGKTLVPNGATGPAHGYYPNDKRIRVAFNSTIKVRNRFAENR